MGEEKAQARANGDAAGARLEALYRRYVGRVYALALRLLISVSAAEDATVKVFVRLGRELADWWDESRTLARLRELVIDESLILLGVRERMAGRQAAVPVAPHTEDVARPPLDAATLDTLTAQLPTELRVAFVLHDQEGLSDRTIATHLHLAEPEVRRLIHSAHFELRRLWLKQA